MSNKVKMLKGMVENNKELIKESKEELSDLMDKSKTLDKEHLREAFIKHTKETIAKYEKEIVKMLKQLKKLED
jgi:hypothetical protein